ncbi:hypothetical protein VNO80_25232 [Phaseolus coccineus]|uniref:Uncharacterized protein n=1 Tax=Phaseolus coccineus TaxID=3886 RepID=A0AAN9LTW5_PHACN
MFFSIPSDANSGSLDVSICLVANDEWGVGQLVLCFLQTRGCGLKDLKVANVVRPVLATKHGQSGTHGGIVLSDVVHALHSRPTRASAGAYLDGCYLVDPASSHMLVSKIKPCMWHNQDWIMRLNLTQHGKTYQIIAIVGLQRGIPSKRESSTRVDYVLALCSHHPSLLPIEWFGEV